MDDKSINIELEAKPITIRKYSSIATTQCCRIFLREVSGKETCKTCKNFPRNFFYCFHTVEMRLWLTNRWASGLPQPVLDGHKIIDGLLKRCFELWLTWKYQPEGGLLILFSCLFIQVFTGNLLMHLQIQSYKVNRSQTLW